MQLRFDFERFEPRAACGGGGGGGGGNGGAANAGTGGVRRLDAGAPCKTLELTTGQTAPDGTLALWAPTSASPSIWSPVLDNGYLYYTDGS